MSVEMGSGDGHHVGDRETVAAVDDIDGQPHLVVADITRDSAWVAVRETSALPLDEWE